MAEIVGLDYPANVTLIEGATQFWSDVPKNRLDVDWSDVLLPHIEGRTLVIGWLPSATLAAIVDKAAQTHVLTRGIPDATKVANTHPDLSVWCGDPRALAVHTEPFDSVLCLTDASIVLPLESEDSSWEDVTRDIEALAGKDGAVVIWIENDLGIHRLTASHNPRAERSTKDWGVMRTWDETRPRSLEQVRAVCPDADVWLTWPSESDWTLLTSTTHVDAALHAALAFHTAATPLRGPDPAYILSAAAEADRLTDFASGWLVVNKPLLEAKEVSALLARRGQIVPFTSGLSFEGRLALSVFAELAATEDMGLIRRFIAAWSSAFPEDTNEAVTKDPALGLTMVSGSDAEGWQFRSLLEAQVSHNSRWVALGELVGHVQSRAWRAPWPATFTSARILNHLGVMAGLRPITPAQAKQLIPQPTLADPFSGMDKQGLVAAVDRNNEAISALRSKLALAELDLQNARARAVPAQFVAPVRALASVRRRANNLARRLSSRLSRLAGRQCREPTKHDIPERSDHSFRADPR